MSVVAPAAGRGRPRTAPWGARTARAAAAGVVGLAAIAEGFAARLPHAILVGPSLLDVAGVALGVAGLVLVGFAFRAAFAGRRMRVKLLAIPVVLALAQWFVVPVVGAGLAVNAPHHHVPPAATLGLPGARDVTFPARGSVRLAAWYVPGRNGAGVVLMHGAHGDRADVRDHLFMLARRGYAVLAFDARGHGASGGQPNALGWGGDDDLAGAVAFLRRQPGVDPMRIAAVGVSMGAEASLRAAASGVPLRAVVADGAGASTHGDRALVEASPLPASVDWVTMRATEALAGESEPAPLRDVVGRVHVPVLLIASNAPDEGTIDRAFRDRIGSKARVWSVPDAGHTDALHVHPDAYAAHVYGFLATALRRR